MIHAAQTARSEGGEAELNLPLDLCAITEAAARAVWPLVGRGDKHAIDAAGTDAMRAVLARLNVAARVVIGEGELDEAPMLFIGEQLGRGGLALDLAVDPVEGTEAVSLGCAGGVAVIAAAERGGLLGAPDMYMQKLVVGPPAAGKLRLEDPLAFTLERLADCHGRRVSELCIVVQDRPRHADLVAELRRAGARVRLMREGDVMAALEVVLPGYEPHALMGIGGAPEGVVTAAALRGLGGEIQAKFKATTMAEELRCAALGLDLERVYSTCDLAPGKAVYFAVTAITPAAVLRGIRACDAALELHSLTTDSASGTMRFVKSVWKLESGR